MKRHTAAALLLVPAFAALLLLTPAHDGAARRAAAGQGATRVGSRSGPSEATLPPGVKAVWDMGKARREKTATRSRVCLNGLWRWQPARDGKGAVPADGWGFF